MHIYFSGIGGTGIGPLAMIARQAGYKVSGSDARDSQYIEYLKKSGLSDIHIGQTADQIETVHRDSPIDWLVYSSAIGPNSPEINYAKEQSIRVSKRDDLLNEILSQKKLKLIAIAGTHGKTTTTAMIIWSLKQFEIPVSYSVGAKISFGEMGEYDPKSDYFVYECDEFDRNFLAFKPYLATITGISWDHHEIYQTKDEYLGAFRQFLGQSTWTALWKKDQDQLGIANHEHLSVLSEDDPAINTIGLLGWHNRANAWQAAQAVHHITKLPIDEILNKLSIFPGVSRRFERITDNLYSDYAHTPEKIMGAMATATDAVSKTGQKIIVIYEPLTNRRMHYTREQHRDIFGGSSALYWVPSYLAREDPSQEILSPDELIKSLSPELQKIAKPMELNNSLKTTIENHLKNGDLVLALSGGGGNSLDEWLRKEF